MARELACGETYGEPELYGERQRQRADLVFQGRLEGYLEGVRLGGVTRRAEEGQRRAEEEYRRRRGGAEEEAAVEGARRRGVTRPSNPPLSK